MVISLGVPKEECGHSLRRAQGRMIIPLSVSNYQFQVDPHCLGLGGLLSSSTLDLQIFQIHITLNLAKCQVQVPWVWYVCQTHIITFFWACQERMIIPFDVPKKGCVFF
jgi:hypothetical protein